MSTCVRSRAWEFSYVTSCTSGSWPMSRKCRRTASPMGTSRNEAPSSSASFCAFDFVRPVVPKPGMETA